MITPFFLSDNENLVTKSMENDMILNEKNKNQVIICLMNIQELKDYSVQKE